MTLTAPDAAFGPTLNGGRSSRSHRYRGPPPVWPPVPTASQVSTDGQPVISGGPGGSVPEVGVVEQDVAPFLVEADLLRDAFEPQRDPLGARAMAAGQYPQKSLAGEVGSKWMVKATPGQMSR